jgi:hypothetical protein
MSVRVLRRCETSASRSVQTIARGGAGWLAGLVAGAALVAPVAHVEGAAWSGVDRTLGAPVAILVVALAFVFASMIAAVTLGALRLPGREAGKTSVYVARMLRFWVRELVAGGYPSNGRRNQRYATLEDFEAEDHRRVGPTQSDFGVGWHARGRRGRDLRDAAVRRQHVGIVVGQMLQLLGA